MRRRITTFALLCLTMAMTAGIASAAPPHSGCPAGPSGTGQSTIGAFDRWDLATWVANIEATGGDVASAPAAFESVDRNGDGIVCVMTQVLPNDASGNTTFFVPVDNSAGR